MASSKFSERLILVTCVTRASQTSQMHLAQSNLMNASNARKIVATFLNPASVQHSYLLQKVGTLLHHPKLWLFLAKVRHHLSQDNRI